MNLGITGWLLTLMRRATACVPWVLRDQDNCSEDANDHASRLTIRRVVYLNGSAAASIASLTFSSIHFWNSSGVWMVTNPRIAAWPNPQS